MLPFIFQLQPFDLPRVSNDTACASDNNSKGAQHPFFYQKLSNAVHKWFTDCSHANIWQTKL